VAVDSLLVTQLDFECIESASFELRVFRYVCDRNRKADLKTNSTSAREESTKTEHTKTTTSTVGKNRQAIVYTIGSSITSGSFYRQHTSRHNNLRLSQVVIYDVNKLQTGARCVGTRVFDVINQAGS